MPSLLASYEETASALIVQTWVAYVHVLLMPMHFVGAHACVVGAHACGAGLCGTSSILQRQREGFLARQRKLHLRGTPVVAHMVLICCC